MPTPSGRVYLCSNAILDNSYNHTIDFKNPSEQQTYWGSLVKYSLSEYSYIRRQRQFIQVDLSLDALQDVNYLYFKSLEDSKTYYCFVLDKEYVSDKNTIIYFDVDVMQTRLFDFKINQSYVLQEHCDRWDADHKPIYSRTEENLNYGSEFTVENAFKIQDSLEKPIKWYLALCKPHNSIIDSGANATEPTVLNGVNPYIMYLLPSTGFVVDGDYYVKYGDNTQQLIGNLTAFNKIMNNSELGSFVQQIIKLPYCPFEFEIIDGLLGSQIIYVENQSTWSNRYDLTNINGIVFLRIKLHISAKHLLAEMGVFEGLEGAMPTAEQWASVKANPYNTERDKRFESKLLTYPYRYNLLSDWKGQPLVIKNEYITGDKIKVDYLQSIAFNAPARYFVENYKKDPEGRMTSLMQLVPEEAPIINDAYYNYLLANKNQIQANQTNAIVNSMANVTQPLIGGAIFGGATGAVAGAVGGALSGIVNYQNMIRSENAKQQDIKNMPDTIIMTNDCTFNIMDENEGVSFYRMKVCCEFEELLADTFNMTGYTVKRVKVPNLKSRARFNYIKTVGANIVGNFDQNDILLIKQIFDKGITFWHYNSVNFKPFDYSLENIENNLL